jgi:hypothetical protein
VPEKRKWVGSAFLGLVGLAALGSGAIGLMYDVVERIYFLAGGVTGLLGASVDPLMWAFERRRSTRFVRQASVPESGESAVVIPCSMSRFWLYLGMLAATVVGLAALGMRQWIVFYLLIAGALAGLLGYYAIQICRKKIVRGHLAMSPSGIYLRSWGSSSFVPWEHVSDVEPGKGDWQPIEVRAGTSTRSWSRRTTHLLGPRSCSAGLTIPGTLLTVDPILVYYALLFYFAHPEARSELGGDAGVRRLRDADFPASLLHRYAYRATAASRRGLYGLKS